jgi:hypothetical protein
MKLEIERLQIKNDKLFDGEKEILPGTKIFIIHPKFKDDCICGYFVGVSEEFSKKDPLVKVKLVKEKNEEDEVWAVSLENLSVN